MDDIKIVIYTNLLQTIVCQPLPKKVLTLTTKVNCWANIASLKTGVEEIN